MLDQRNKDEGENKEARQKVPGHLGKKSINIISFNCYKNRPALDPAAFLRVVLESLGSVFHIP